MKKIIILALTAAMLVGCTYSEKTDKQNNTGKSPQILSENINIPVSKSNELIFSDKKIYKPLNYDFQKAVWLSYIDLAPMLTGKNEIDFRKNFDEACKNISELGCNTVYIHLRPFGDALYNSLLYPQSKYVCGTTGEKGDFDPLNIMLEIAHKYKLSVHGWINPLRCEEANEFENISDEYSIKQWYDNSDFSDYIKEVEGDSHLWLNPAYSDVRNLIADGVREIAENYDIDGIHYDDYFYPTTDESFDSQCYQAMADNETLKEWRLSNITQMIKQIYDEVKAVDNRILVGASPQGNIDNNYCYMYADVKKWCSESGYIDYICPQIYFGYENTIKPFTNTLNEWNEIVTNKDISLVVGLAAYKISSDDEYLYNTGIISRQINDCIACDTDGIALYNYLSLFNKSADMNKRMNEERKTILSALK